MRWRFRWRFSPCRLTPGAASLMPLPIHMALLAPPLLPLTLCDPGHTHTYHHLPFFLSPGPMPPLALDGAPWAFQDATDIDPRPASSSCFPSIAHSSHSPPPPTRTPTHNTQTYTGWTCASEGQTQGGNTPQRTHYSQSSPLSRCNAKAAQSTWWKPAASARPRRPPTTTPTQASPRPSQGRSLPPPPPPPPPMPCPWPCRYRRR
jgi:hypothetical protein